MKSIAVTMEPVEPMAPALSARLTSAVNAGLIPASALDPKILADLAQLPEATGLIVVDRFLASNLASVRNPSAFLADASVIAPKLISLDMRHRSV